jgi:ADP-ribose pyrophosphatase YjhB (NUDIX family)
MDYQLPPSPKTQINLAYPFQKLYTKTSYDCVTGTIDAVLHTCGTHAGPKRTRPVKTQIRFTPTPGGIAMIEATSCGGVVIFRGKILVLYKNYKNKYEGWVLPKGTVEAGEEYKETALREVKEETGVSASIIKYIGKSQYSFNTPQDVVEKDVHWYLMMADSYYSKPQREEYFLDSGYYKFYEAYHLLKFSNEKQILEKAYNEYLDLKKSNLWGSKKYF